MALRGALNRGVNVGLAVVLLAPPCMLVYQWYADDPSTLRWVLLRVILGYLLGVMVSVPVFMMNRRAVADLYDELTGKFFLSSQLALLDSRQGKNATAYFYTVMILVRTFTPLICGPWTPAISAFPYGLYLGANVLPFVFLPRRQTE